MSNWVRLWEDMPNDPKWRVIAKRSGRPIAEVLAVFVHMMTNAGTSADRGTLAGWNDEDVAAALDMEPEHVEAIRDAMQGKTLEGEKLSGWEKRQPKREDGAAERAKEWRERQKLEAERNRTQENAPEPPEKNRIDTDKIDTPRVARVSVCRFPEFYEAYPKHVERKAAETKYAAVVKSGVSEQALISAAQAYGSQCRSKGVEAQFIKSPVVWLNKGCWDDELPGSAAVLPFDRPPPPKTDDELREIARQVWADTDRGRVHERQ